MSLCEDMLLCNYRKCRIKLSGYAWVTACSHIFCDQHGSGEFSRSPAICPACNSTLSGKLDIVRTELSPSEEYKAMVLAGLRPEVVLDISSRALAFWTYQIHQERLYQEYNFSKAENHLKQMEKIYTQQIQSKDVELTSMKGEVTSMKKVLEEYKKKFSDISEKLMERNRQYQKLQGLYDSLRLRNITIASQEGSLEQVMIPQSGVFGFPVGNSSKFPLDHTPLGNRGDGDEDAQFRPFFVGSPQLLSPLTTSLVLLLKAMKQSSKSAAGPLKQKNLAHFTFRDCFLRFTLDEMIGLTEFSLHLRSWLAVGCVASCWGFWFFA